MKDIIGSLPHRGAAVLIDEVLEITQNTATGLKTFREEDRAFEGHFPGLPIVPGVLILDALAQLSGLISFKGIAFLASVSSLRFFRQVRPNEAILLSAKQDTRTPTAAQFRVEAFVNGQHVLKGSIVLGGGTDYTVPAAKRPQEEHTMKLVGVGTYEVLEDEKGRPTVRISGHLLKTGEVFRTVLNDSHDIVKAVGRSQPAKERKPLAEAF